MNLSQLNPWRLIYRLFFIFHSPTSEKTDNKIINKGELKKIIFHRGRMLLLDEVIIGPERIIGKLFVRKKFCKGHCIPGQGLVMKGSDLLDMAAQIVAIAIASMPQYSHLKGKKGFAREYGLSRFKKTILPGETILMELSTDQIFIETPSKSICFVMGKKFSIRNISDKKEKKATIDWVKIAIISD